VLSDSIRIAIYWTAVTPPRTPGLMIRAAKPSLGCGHHTYIPISRGFLYLAAIVDWAPPRQIGSQRRRQGQSNRHQD
jgi:hypothetical protein